jgi:hypothetical protein
MNEEDIEKILKTVDKSSSERLLNLNNSKIKQYKNDLFQRLNFKPILIKELHKKLKDYRFVDDLKDIEFGRYIRWINLNNYENIKLTNGGIICQLKTNDNSGTLIVCRNKLNRLFTLKMEECLIFQKLRDDEKLLLKALDFISK